jgi:galactoside O-acetyltransferase
MDELGLRYIGENVLISDKCSIYGTDIMIGNNVRIDDFCILSGKIALGNNIHIGAYSALYGKFGIEMDDYTGLSPRCTIFSATDDFGGNYLISPMNPEKYCNVTGGKVLLKKFVQIGSGTVIMPNLTLEEGVAIGAMSFVKKSQIAWRIYAGNPLHFIKFREYGMEELANKIEEDELL